MIGFPSKKWKHGHARKNGFRTGTYNSWHSMKQRCYNKPNPYFHNYGGRGITVFSGWHSFAGFLADMGNRPAGMTLDRINNDKNYEPGNCRWATKEVQMANRRDSRLYTYRGKNLCIAQWARRANISYATLTHRLLKKGWTISKAITTSIRGKKKEIKG